MHSDLVFLIFRWMKHPAYQTLARVCKLWKSWMTNINVLVKIWPITPDFEGYFQTTKFLDMTRIAPSIETASRLRFGWDSENRLVVLFIRHYQPLWAAVRLPIPDFTEVTTYSKILRFYGEGRHGDNHLTSLLESAIGNKYAFRYLYAMYMQNEVQIGRFLGNCLDRIWYPDSEYVLWLASLPCCRVTPYTIRQLIERGLDLDAVKILVELPTTDWDGWNCQDVEIPEDECRATCYESAYRAYEWVWFFRDHALPPEGYMNGFAHFYKLVGPKVRANAIEIARAGGSKSNYEQVLKPVPNLERLRQIVAQN